MLDSTRTGTFEGERAIDDGTVSGGRPYLLGDPQALRRRDGRDGRAVPGAADRCRHGDIGESELIPEFHSAPGIRGPRQGRTSEQTRILTSFPAPNPPLLPSL